MAKLPQVFKSEFSNQRRSRLLEPVRSDNEFDGQREDRMGSDSTCGDSSL